MTRPSDDEILLFWAGHIAPRYQGILSHQGWEWLPDQQTYKSRHGTKLDQDDLRAMALSLVMSTKDQLKEQSAMIAGPVIHTSRISQWRTAIAGTIALAYWSLAALGAGGIDAIEPEDVDTVVGSETVGDDLGTGLADADMRLTRFAGQIADGSIGGQAIADRAGMYANGGYGVFQDVRRNSHGRATTADGVALFTHEENILDPFSENHCNECPDLSDLGPVPIGTLPEIGTRECGANDRCHFQFSRQEPEAEII